MSKIIAASFAGLILAAAAAPTAPAASRADRNLAALQRQVRTLQKQVKGLSGRVKTLERYRSTPYIGATCLAALTSDLFEGTWAVIDQVAGRTIFGPQTQLDDYGNCGYLDQPKVPRPPVQVPPSISIFNPMIQWLHVPVS